MATISRDGGWWNHEIHAGAAHRDLLDTPTTSEVNVASKCRHQKQSNIIRIGTMSTKI